jgi:HEAT repeat protein
VITRRRFFDAAWAGLIAGLYARPFGRPFAPFTELATFAPELDHRDQPMDGPPSEIIAVLRRFAQEPGGARDEPCLQAIARVNDDAILGLAKALDDADDDVRLLALEMLCHLGPKAEPALPRIIRRLDDPNRLVRIAAAAPLATFREKARAAVPILQTWLCRKDEFSRVTAAGDILLIDPSRVEDLLPILVDALDSERCGVCSLSACYLCQLGTLARAALPKLERMLNDDDSSRRCSASEAIWAITGDPNDVIRVGRDLLDDSDWLQRCVGAEHLGMLGAQGLPAVPSLLRAKDDGDEIVRSAVIDALAAIRSGPFFGRRSVCAIS